MSRLKNNIKTKNDLLKIFKFIFNIQKNIKILNLQKKKIKNWDSINHLNLLFAIEQKFKIKLNDKQSIGCQSFLEFYEEIIKYKNVK
jgi:acyl carrier protein